jgi:hypothetical protein
MAKKPTLQVVGYPASTSPQPPRPLGVHGQSLWNRIQSEYAVGDSGGVELLAQACEGLDLAGRLREQINADGEVIRVRGVPKAHPAVRDLLQAQAFVTRTLARLGLDVEPLRSGPGRPPTPGAW